MALMKKLTSAVVASSLVLGLAGVAAATTPDKVQAAATRMQKLNLVKGVDASGTDLALNANLTRAQLVTILVRAFGQDANAKYLDGAAAFTDTANHPWASGYIAMAKRIIAERTNGKEVVGLPDGSFNPDGNVTAAEAVAFLMKFVGAPADSTKAWPDNYISGALNAGIITAEDKTVLDGIKNTPATRGLAFYLADRAFYGYKLAEGGTVYTTFVDPSAPTVTVDNADNSNTLEEKVTVTGTVSADVVSVTVGSLDNAATITDGKFTASVNLAIGENSILVHAVDRAGNASEKTVKVTRTVGAAASIEASDITVAAGGTAAVTATVKDAKGNAITGATVTGESTVGTFDGTSFKAGEKAGEGTLTLKVGEVTKSVKVTVTAGALAAVTASNATPAVGERVTLSAADQYGNAVTGATYTVDSADALLDSTQGILIASKAGNFTVTATKDGKSATLKVGVYSGTIKDAVVVAPEAVVGNSILGDADNYGSEYTITVKAVDGNGNLVANFNGKMTLGQLPDGFALADGEVAVKKATNGVASFKVIAGENAVGTQAEFNAAIDADKSDDNTFEVTSSASATVEIQEQVATSVKFDAGATAKYIRANDETGTTNVAAYIADQNGERFLAQAGYVIKYSLTGPAKFTSNEDVSVSKTYLGTEDPVAIHSVKGLTGDVTVTATVDGLGTATVTTTAAIATDAAAITVKADKAEATANGNTVVTYSVQAVDKNGVPVVGTYNLKASFNSDSTSEFDAQPVVSGDATVGTFTTTPDADNVEHINLTEDATNGVTKFNFSTNDSGKAKFTFTAKQFVGDLKLDVTDVDKELTAASTNVKFVADKATHIGMVRTNYVRVPAASPKVTLTAQVKDDSGNAAPVAGLKATFTAYEIVFNPETNQWEPSAKASSDVTLNGTAKTVDTTTDANGVASVDVSVLGYVGHEYLIVVTGEKASGDALLLNTNAVSVYVDNAIATNLTATLNKAATDPNTGDFVLTDGVATAGASIVSTKAGAPIKVTVTAKDAAGKTVSGDRVKLIPSGTAYVWDATTQTIAKDADNNDVKIDKTSGYVMSAEDNGVYTLWVVPQTSGSFSFTLKDTTPGTQVSIARTVRVAPADAYEFVINDGSAVTVDANTASGAVTVKLADLFGNPVIAANKTYFQIAATKVGDATNTPVNVGIRTSVGAQDLSIMSIAAGTSSSTFYVYNSLPKGTYTVIFTQVKDSTGAPMPTEDANGNPLPPALSGTFTLTIQ